MFWQYGLVAVLIGCWSGAFLGGCGPAAAPSGSLGTGDSSASSASSTAPVMKVTAKPPERKTLVRKTEQPGQILAFEETPVFGKVSGFVHRVVVDMGDPVQGPRYDDQGNLVKPGQVLAELSVPELEDELRQRQALVAKAEAEVKQADAAIKVAEAAAESAAAQVAEARASVDRVQAEYLRVKAEFERVSELVANKAITRKSLDEVENQLKAADASRGETAAKIRSAQAKVAEAQAGVDKAKADHAAAQAKLQVAQADEQRSRTMLDYTTLRAPFDGYVTTRHIDTGHLVHVGSGPQDRPLFVVVRGDIVRVFIEVPESEAVFVGPQSPVTIRIPSLGGKVIPATVKRSSWTLHSSTRTLRTEINLDNQELKLRPGMYVHAELVVATRENVLSLPKGAVLMHEQKSYCLCVDDENTVRKVEIETGLRAGDAVEVVSGLTGSERVITINPAAYREGQKVEISVTPAK